MAGRDRIGYSPGEDITNLHTLVTKPTRWARVQATAAAAGRTRVRRLAIGTRSDSGRGYRQQDPSTSNGLRLQKDLGEAPCHVGRVSERFRDEWDKGANKSAKYKSGSGAARGRHTAAGQPAWLSGRDFNGGTRRAPRSGRGCVWLMPIVIIRIISFSSDAPSPISVVMSAAEDEQ